MNLLLAVPVVLAIGAAVPAMCADARCTRVPHTDTKFTPPVFRDLSEWESRRVVLRKQILAATGLLPAPERPPIKAEVFGRRDRDGVSIEKVLIETLPGYYLGGNLYRPRGKSGKFPAVLIPHGHWIYGRLENQQLNSTPRQGITMAKQGYVVLAYDMIGYNDTIQAPHEFIGRREQLWNFGPMQIQTWNSIRALDFVASLPDVDTTRLGITGASGGGTQTFILAATDDRISFAAPVNMVSTRMQGGCDCENAPGLRIDTTNVEIASLIAPRPMILIAGPQDWTKDMPKEDFPAIQAIYALYGKPDAVANAYVEAPHNYNRESREHVYRFFGKHVLGVENSAALVEEDEIDVERLQDMLVLQGRTLPAGALTFDQLFEYWRQRAERSIAAQKDATALREILALTFHADFPASVQSLPSGDHIVLSRKGVGDEVPAVFIPGRGTPAVLVHPAGIAGARASSAFSALRASGRPVLMIDAFQTGSAVAPRDKSVKFFLTFNATDDAARVQDILTAVAHLRAESHVPVEIVGVDNAAVWALFAAALSPSDVIHKPDIGAFTGTDDDYMAKFFVPGIQAAGGTKTALRLVSARPN